MKRLIVPFLGLLTLFFPISSANAQRGGPGGTRGAAGGMGASGTHVDSATARESHGSSNPMASTDPGMVLEHNTNLAAKLETLTNTTNLTDLEKDASAFRNFGQFVAAAHVSKNLNIPGGFAALMCEMTTKIAVGATSCANNKKMSLGKAIQRLDPQADAQSESKKGTQQAKQDIEESGS